MSISSSLLLHIQRVHGLFWFELFFCHLRWEFSLSNLEFPIVNMSFVRFMNGDFICGFVVWGKLRCGI